MIRLGLRLAVATGREARVRFAVLAAAVALGVGLLLCTVAGLRALDSQIGRGGWIRGAHELTSVSNAAPEISVDALDLVLSVVAAGLLFPVLVFIGTATRLSATRRERRFAAMRLIGATPRQVAQLAAVEAAAAAVVGTAAGLALFPALRAGMSGMRPTAERFFPADLSPGWPAVVLIAAGVPAAAAVAARLAMRRVRISPLGVARRVTPRPPRAWRLIPAAAGLLRMLRNVVALESAVPLFAAAILAVGNGFAAAQLFLRARMGYTMSAPGWDYYVPAAVGLAVSLGIIASTLPLLERVTGPETARNE
jgi:hypothetical protein